MYVVESGDIRRDSLLFQMVSAAVLTAYGYQPATDNWSELPALYGWTEAMFNRHGKSCLHMLQGIGGYGQGTKQVMYSSSKEFFAHHNLVVPSIRTSRKSLPPAQANKGIHASDLANYIACAGFKSRIQIETEWSTSILVVMATDGMVIRPSLGLSVSSNPSVGCLVGLEGNPVPHSDVVSLSNQSPDTVVEMLRTAKWSDSAVEVHATTLDAALSDTLSSCFHGKGGNKAKFLKFVRMNIDDVTQCTCCLGAALTEDANSMANQAGCDSYCRCCIDANEFCAQHLAFATSRGHWHCAKARCSKCVSPKSKCVHLWVVGLAVDCEPQQAATLREVPQDFNGHMCSFPDPRQGGYERR